MKLDKTDWNQQNKCCC